MNKNKKSHTQILTQKESQNSNPSINSSIKYSINSSISEPANKSEIKSKGSSLESTTQSISSHQSLASTTHTSNSRYKINTKAENKNTWQQLSQQIEATLQSIGLQKGSKIAVGVSGGADSVFLALALHRLGFYVNAVIIDHKLRQNSTQEAIYTANTMQQHNIKADILTWNHQNKHDNPNFQYQSENRENNKQDEQENENETNLNNLDNNFNNTIKTINETNITKSSQHVITQNQNDASLQLQTQPSQSIISLQQINRSHQATHNNTNKNTSMETTETEMKGMETKAREARYALFQKYCTQHNIKHLFIAHHLNDQVETFFINLFRGSGIKGLCAMQTCSKLQTKQTSNIANPTTNNIAENPNFQYQSENRENNKQDEQENENETNTTDPSLHNSAANQNPSTVKQSTTILNKQKFAKLKHLQQITILSNALMQSSNSSQRGRISKLQQLLTNITTSSNGKSTLMHCQITWTQQLITIQPEQQTVQMQAMQMQAKQTQACTTAQQTQTNQLQEYQSQKPQSQADQITLIRPMLNIKKADIINALTEESIPWIEDLSNADTEIQRNMIRDFMSKIPNAELVNQRIFNTIQHLNSVNEIIEEEIDAITKSITET